MLDDSMISDSLEEAAYHLRQACEELIGTDNNGLIEDLEGIIKDLDTQREVVDDRLRKEIRDTEKDINRWLETER